MGTITEWITNNIFINYKKGIYLEIIKNKVASKHISYVPFLNLSWKCYLNIIPPGPKKQKQCFDYLKGLPTNNIFNNKLKSHNHLETILNTISTVNTNPLFINNIFIHCFVAHTSTIYPLLSLIDLSKYRFGTIILKISDKKVFNKTRYKTRITLEKNYYHFYKHIDNYDCYVSSVGFPPYYLGQPILDKYLISGNFKSGCGSTGVYMIRDENDNKYVLKRSNTDLTFQRELNSLKLTKKWKHSPTLIDYDIKNKIIITNWCGKDFKVSKMHKKYEMHQLIQNLCDILYTDYKLYHNDIRWKNITLKDNTIILIDWGMSSDEKREKDPEHILRPDQSIHNDKNNLNNVNNANNINNVNNETYDKISDIHLIKN